MANMLPELAINPIASTAIVRAQEFMSLAQSYVIDCPEMAEAANADLKEIKAYAKQLDAAKKEVKTPIAEKVKQIDAFFKAPSDFLSRAESALKGSLTRYLDEIEKRRQEEIRKAQAEAEAERQRIAEMMQADAEVLDAEYEVVMPVVVPSEVITATDTPKLDGIVKRKVWSAEVTDAMAIIKAIAAGTSPIECVTINQSFLNKLASTYKGSLEVPGVNFVETTSLASRG